MRVWELAHSGAKHSLSAVCCRSREQVGSKLVIHWSSLSQAHLLDGDPLALGGKKEETDLVSEGSKKLPEAYPSSKTPKQSH